MFPYISRPIPQVHVGSLHLLHHLAYIPLCIEQSVRSRIMPILFNSMARNMVFVSKCCGFPDVV